MESTEVVINATSMGAACDMGDAFTMVWAGNYCDLGGELSGWLCTVPKVGGEAAASGHGNTNSNHAEPRSSRRGFAYAGGSR